MALHFMSDKELSRVEILRDLTAGRLTVSAASELMGLERRQVLRLSKAYQEHGATALISKKRGRASNRQMPTDIKAQALELIKARYADFGPTLAAEKLREVHGITVGRETLRLWMLDAGLWADRVKRRGRVYQPRYRRECVGELVQVDGSEHWWFEDPSSRRPRSAAGSRSWISPTAVWRSATRTAACPTAPSINCGALPRRPCSRTSASAASSP